MMLQGCRKELLIESLANRSASDGLAVFPNLGYKKDAFLEPSLVSNNFSSPPNKSTTIPTLNTTALFLIAPCPPTACNSNNHSLPLLLLALIPGLLALIPGLLALIPGLLALLLEVLLVLYLWTPLGVRLNRYRREVR